ncbi:MAG: restriction endonuclease, partial [Rhodobacteraceae bacterium]|nr:restriction endonuclease [Paracoccaceae bacterium]
GSGAGKEIDLFGAAGSEVWIGQSKWWMTKKVGLKELRGFLAQGEQVKAERSPRTLRLWLFAYSGLTPKAHAFAREHGILWSSKTDLNALLRLLGLRELPELSREIQDE